MRKLLAFAALAALGTTMLSGCASQPPALTKKDVKLALAASETKDLLTGDKITIATTGNLLHHRTDKVKVTIESSADGKSWSPAKSATASAKSLAVELPVSLDAAGSVEYRASVSTRGAKSKTVFTTEPIKIETADIKQLVRSLFYDYVQAYTQGTAAGTSFDAAHDYPGIFDTTGAAWTTGVAKAQADGLVSSLVPDLASITPDPMWMMPATSCSAAQTTAPSGRTFSVSVDEHDTYTNYLPYSGKSVLHVTLLNGSTYFYMADCAYS